MIFEYLPFKDIVYVYFSNDLSKPLLTSDRRNMRVSSRWRQVLQSPILWRDISVKPSGRALRKPLQPALVQQILATATSIKGIVWQVAHQDSDLDILLNLICSSTCAKLERLEISYRDSCTGTTSVEAIIQIWEAFVETWIDVVLHRCGPFIRAIRFGQPLMFSLRMFTDLLNNCPNVEEAEVAISLHSHVHGNFHKWLSYPKLHRLAMSRRMMPSSSARFGQPFLSLHAIQIVSQPTIETPHSPST